MAFTIITEDILREVVGRVGKSERFWGIAQPTVQDIINYHEKTLEDEAARRVPEFAGQYPDLFNDRSVSLAADTPTGLKKGTIAANDFPYVLQAVATGQPLAYEPKLELLVLTSPVAAASLYAFVVRGREIYVSPTSLDSITVWVAPSDDILKRVLTEDEKAKVRARIIDETYKAALRIYENWKREEEVEPADE